MDEKVASKQYIQIWQKHNAKLVLILLLIIFSAYSVFLATHLQTAIIPDETYRFEVATYFADTVGIPDDVPIAYSSGDNLHRNPYLGYWLYARAINIFQLFQPAAMEWQTLVALRVVNWLFALGTVVFIYGLSKELISNKWWQLFPVFMATNTLMFVFLSGGVNYDNPTIFACTAAIYFFVRALKKENFIIDSLAWAIFISVACLIKYSILPLALVLAIIWFVDLIRNRKTLQLESIKKWHWGAIVLLIILIGLVFLNIALYGVNLVKFHALTPACIDTFPQEVCASSFFGMRHNEMALPEKLTLIGAFKQGYPEPVRYFFDEWVREMLKRTYGIMGEKNYFPNTIAYFQVALFWVLLLGFRYVKKLDFIKTSLMIIFGFYTTVLVAMNYNSELIYGFNKYVALQGRYIFPVISIAFSLCAYILTKVRNKYIRYGTLIALIALFLYGGPVRFLWYYNSVFADWFI